MNNPIVVPIQDVRMNAITSFTTVAPRVALFSGNYNYTRDGANRALNRLVDFLERRGVAVRVYSPTGDRPAFAHAGEVVSVPSIAIPRRKEYRLAIGLTERVKEDLRAFRPNIFHLSAPDVLGYKALKLARAWNIPAVASVHTRFDTYLQYYGLSYFEKFATRYLRAFYQQCEQIYAPSDSMGQILRVEGMSDDVRIWGRGVDSDHFSPERRDPTWRAAYGISETDTVIAFVGRLVLEKGLETFADVMDVLKNRNVAHKVLIVGDGPERAWMQRRLPDAIFAGHMDDSALARAYASSDLFFNPSRTETFGNVTLEAMASGVPPVCAQAAGSMSLVQHGTTGFLAANGNVGEYAHYLARLVGDRGLRRSFAQASRLRALNYNWDNILGEVLANYCEVLQCSAARKAPANETEVLAKAS